jgi:hypothetical protein
MVWSGQRCRAKDQVHACRCRAAIGTHPVDRVFEGDKIRAAHNDHHVDITDNVPSRDHVGLTSKESFEMVEPKPWEAHKNERLQAG